MLVSLLTDAPKHNLALMKLSAFHKKCGDEVVLNQDMPLFKADKTYASILFTKNTRRYYADEFGGPAFSVRPMGERRGRVCGGKKECEVVFAHLPPDIERMVPDYSLYSSMGYSLGYTYRPCFRGCDFCVVGKMDHPDVSHHSIWEFHDSKFRSICLLNNNTFMDAQWKETFEEIWDARLSVVDENGYDLRLLDDEKAEALHKTKWVTPLHFAWDRMDDEAAIVRGLGLLRRHHLSSTSNGVYVLIGRDTTEEDDLHRCQIINDHGLTPYPMPFVKNAYTRSFKRFINLHYYRRYKTIAEAWSEYGGSLATKRKP